MIPRPPLAPEPPQANRKGLIRLVLAVVLLVLGWEAAGDGHYLHAAANAVLAAFAAMLAWATLPGRRLPPRPVLLGTLGAGVALWLASVAVGAR